MIERQIRHQIRQLKESGDVEELLHGRWAHMEELDEDEWMEHLEEHLKEIVNISGKMSRRWRKGWKNTENRSRKELPPNIRNWLSGSGSGGIYWINI